MAKEKKNGLNISVRSFITAIAVIFALMVLSYVLTLVIPGGSYARMLDANGNTVIDTAGGFSYVEGGIPFWKWILSPVLVLGASGSGTLIAVIAFLPFVQKWLSRTNNTYDLIFNLADAIGLGVFTVVGVNAGFTALGEPNLFLAILLGVFTGVGGGVLRDVMAQNAPTIFVKHFYATASIIGALACALVHMYWSELAASIIGTVVVIVLRVLAMIFKWNLPKPKYFVEHKDK